VADVSSAEAPEADPGAIAGPVDLEEPAFNGQSEAPTAPNLSDEDTPLGWGRTVAPPGGARREELIAPASTPKSIVVDLSEPELEPASSAEGTATASPDGAVELAPAEETEPATMEAETMSAPAAPPAGFPQPEESAHSLEPEEPVESSEPAEAIAYAEAVDVDSPPELPDSAGSGRPRRRFRGIVELDPERVGEDAGLVADDVVAVLRLLADDKVSVQLVLESSLSPEADDSDLEALFSRCRRQRFQVAEVEDE
jgi:hypothetical protein